MAEPTEQTPKPIAEISHAPSAFESFLDRNQKSMILLALVLALGGGVWVVMQGMKEGAHLDAGMALVDAEDLAAMQDVVKNHADTPSAPTAALLLSDLQWDEGQQSSSLETLREEIAANPDHPATAPARARLGARLLEQGETEAAKAAFQEILDRPAASYLAPYALTSLAEIARESGDIDGAKKLLAEATDNYPANPLGSNAGQAAQFVSFEMPEEIDPPAPEPDPTGPADTDPDMGDAGLPDPDLSTPIELDPANPLSGGGSNPLLDNLTGGAAGGEDEAMEPEETAPTDPPSDEDEAPADGTDDSAPAEGE
ncbi:tetratricopeptide repeat-containing protein [Haloferula helveola]|uniref:Tetratricopeptide repeat-containing protein n=1 Tax=Haloferula helveola TaxID=490095 RepID=A0ABN6H3U1_9BACT|nr:tetratricopeptide repeat-containing protein [Haloferula helveola]